MIFLMFASSFTFTTSNAQIKIKPFGQLFGWPNILAFDIRDKSSFAHVCLGVVRFG